MSHHIAHSMLYTVVAVVGLAVLASGPVGLAIAIMIGLPLLAFGGFEAIAHSGKQTPSPRDRT